MPSSSARPRAALVLALAGVLGLAGCAVHPGPTGAWGRQLGQGLGSSSAGFERLALNPPGYDLPGWGPTRAEIRRAATIVSRMTLAQRAGQVIVAASTGYDAPARQVRALHLGGIIVQPSGTTIQPAVARRTAEGVDREVSRRGYPAFVGIDQEGGSVTRLGAPATDFPDFMATGAADQAALTRAASRASAAELKRLGFTVVFAPDADVTIGAQDPAIGSRSAGGWAGLVARQVLAAMDGIEQTGVIPVLKHFPGHGSVTTDSHLGVAVQPRSVSALMRRDLVPFRAAIAAGAPAVMTGHIELTALDRHPASASYRVTTGLLRDRLGFHGLVVTDALNMLGIQDIYPGATASVQALRAGADVLLMPPDPRAARDRIVQAVHSGHLSGLRLDDAAVRMVATLIHARRRGGGAAPGSGSVAAAALAQAAVTSVGGACRGDQLPHKIRVSGPAAQVGWFRGLARADGVAIQLHRPRRHTIVEHVVRKRRVLVRGRPGKRDDHYVVKRVHRTVRRPGPPPPPPAPLVALVGFDQRWPVAADVLVAMDRPTVLGAVRARVKLATFGSSYASVRDAFDFLSGRGGAPGRLPLPVAGVSRPGC